MKKASTFITLIVAQLIYRLSFLLPRSKQTWVCIGWHTGKERELFADNSKYFFLSAQAQCPEVKLVWLARDNSLAAILRDAGFSAYSIHSLKGRFYALRAEYTIIDAYLETAFWQYTGGSKIIQLWHGKGMKKTGYDSSYSTTSRSRFLQPGFFAPLYRLIAASPYTAKLMSSTFRIPLEHIWQTGLPRDDVLFSTIKGAEVDSHLDFHNKVQSLKESGVAKILFYAPTFRTDGSNPLASLDLAALEEFLKTQNYHLFLSLHPKFARKEYEKDAGYTHISYLDSGWDLYPFLTDIDILITDYSSLYVDFLLLDRPMIFYTYDRDTYGKQMGLHEDYDTLTPGPHPKTMNELLQALTATDEHSEMRAKVRQVLFNHHDGNSTARVVEAIKKDW